MAAGDYRKGLMQGYMPAQGAGVFLLRHKGRTVARFMHRRLHEVPHWGGQSSLRQSWWNDEMMDHGERVLDALNWEGVAMLEYRHDPATGGFALIEINFRFWGSLHLALHAGVDFPTLLADHWLIGHSDAENHPVQNIRCRNSVPGEYSYLLSVMKDPEFSRRRKAAALAENLLLTLNPSVRSDLLFPGDRLLFLRQAKRFARTAILDAFGKGG